MKLDMNVQEIGTLLTRSIKDMFKDELKKQLAEIADKVIEETAESLAKDLVMRVESFTSQSAMNPYPEIRVLLRINEKEKQYVIEKTAKEV